MFGPRILGSGLSFTKVIGGISKTLGVVNELIPLYKEAKPLVSNARNAISLIKEFSNTTTKRVMEKTNQNMAPIKEKMQELTNEGNSSITKKGLTFFQ